MEQEFHYPAELLNLLTDAVATLVKSKQNVIDFFRSAGVPSGLLQSWQQKVLQDRDSVYKTDITRDVLCRLNELGDTAIRARREVVRRVVQWEDFTTAYPDKQLIARGLVASVSKVVNAKDSFTRMDAEREREKKERQAILEKQQRTRQAMQEQRLQVRQRLGALFGEPDPQKRGKALEAILNDLFRLYGILVKEAFTLRGVQGKGIIEQIDGVIEFEGHLYLVEMKWCKDSIGRNQISPHLVSIYGRSDVRGLFISASDYSPAALAEVRIALSQKVCVLMQLEEIVRLLEHDVDLKEALHAKVKLAETERKPLVRVEELFRL
jgi:restriction endonuclease Mrr